MSDTDSFTRNATIATTTIVAVDAGKLVVNSETGTIINENSANTPAPTQDDNYLGSLEISHTDPSAQAESQTVPAEAPQQRFLGAPETQAESLVNRDPYPNESPLLASN